MTRGDGLCMQYIEVTFYLTFASHFLFFAAHALSCPRKSAAKPTGESDPSFRSGAHFSRLNCVSCLNATPLREERSAPNPCVVLSKPFYWCRIQLAEQLNMCWGKAYFG